MSDVRYIRSVVDPLFMKLRQELYGSGTSYGNIAQSKLPPVVIVTGGGGGSSGGTDIEDLGYIQGITTLSGSTTVGTNQKQLAFSGNVVVSSVGDKTHLHFPTVAPGSITVAEIDGDPSVMGVTSIVVSGAIVQDLGGGVARILIPSGAFVVDGNRGDITVASGGLSWTINNNAVALGDIQQITTQRLLGRSTAGTGNVEQIALGSGLSLVGGILSASGGALADGDKGDITVTNSGTVWTIDSNVVTLPKIQQIAELTLLGRSAAGTGNVEQLIIGAGLLLTGTTISVSGFGGLFISPMTSTGDMIYRSASVNAERLPIGSNGQILMVSGGIPTWVNANIATSGTGGGASTSGASGPGSDLYLWANFI